MKILTSLLFVSFFTSCTTIHFRSKNTIPVTFEGNPNHQKEVTIVGQKDFLFWGADPDHHEVFIDEEVRKAGYEGISKVVIYEPKSPQNNLISFLTLGIFLPRAYTITGFTSDKTLPQNFENTPKNTTTK